jgi:NAD(P)-dependent dehydrogenase (short-subunit alcohol dehydrogenase family)/cytochrome c2
MSEVVVVTGASAGLGRAIVERFARDGCSIGLIARGEERLESARQSVEALGGRAIVLPLDVADADAVEHAAETVERQLGPIDVWINNAMVSVYSPIKEMSAAEFRRVTEVTYLGYVHGTLSALKRMLPRDRGIIIQVGSALAHRSIPLQSAYCASKHAIMGFHESLLSELLHDRSHVRATMVQMPAMNTPQFDWAKSRMPNQTQPVPPIFQPEVGADAVHHAVRHDVGREFLVAWPTVKAVVGEKFVPAYIDRKLGREGYEGEQTDEPAEPDRPDNLWEPAPGTFGAHGRFDDRARDKSIELMVAKQKPWLAIGGALLLGALLASCTAAASDNGARAASVERGRSLASTRGCATCHEISGVRDANGTIGPSLAHWSERSYIAGVLPNTPEQLQRWIRHPQAVKPGVVMPELALADSDAADIAAFLFTRQ